MIGIVYIQDVKNCPFLSKYTNLLNKKNISYKIIYWNRKGLPGDKRILRSENSVEFLFAQDVSLPKRKKIGGFLAFKRFLNEEIKDCDKLILLTTLTAVLLFDKTYKFRKKYIFDFRDPSFEGKFIFNLMLKKIIANSYFTCISSAAFRTILPDNNYYIAHNFRYEDIAIGKDFQFKKNLAKKKINLVYFGAIREFEHIKNQIELFANDKRYDLYYYGNGSSYLKLANYIGNMQYSNVHLMGEYNNEDKCKFLQHTDIINNHYPMNKNYEICTSNKYYDALIYKRPLLSNYGSIDAKNSMNVGFGIGLRLEEKKDLDILYSWYEKIDEAKFNEACNNALEAIKKDDKKYLDRISLFALS